jgi:predicted nuclease with TOPRIM domain
MVFFTPQKDWKQFLSIDDENRLNDILKKVSKHRGAYRNAPEIKFAQIWCSMLELRKENLLLQDRLEKLEDILGGMFDRIKRQEAEKDRLIESLKRF